jgi:hypothetical protein
MHLLQLPATFKLANSKFRAAGDAAIDRRRRMMHKGTRMTNRIRTRVLTRRLARMLVATLFSFLFGAGPVFANFARVGSLTFNSGENLVRCAVIDPAAGFAYFGNLTAPGTVVKVRLSDFTRVGVLTLNADEMFLDSAVIDPVGGFAYFGTQGSPGIVVKVRLSDFTRVGALSLNTFQNTLASAVIDPAGGFAYFGTDTSPGVVAKVRLSDFTLVSTLTLNAGENRLQSAAIDPAGGFAYFGTLTSPGNVVKIRLSNFTRVGALTLNSSEDQLESVAIDPAGGFAYVGTGTSPASKVVKVRLSDFTRVGALTLDFGEAFLSSAVIDPAAGFAYFGTGTSPASKVVKVRLSDFTRVDAVFGNSGEDFFNSAVIDPAAGFAYFGAQTSPGIVVKIDISAATPPPSVSINDVSQAEGNSGTTQFNFTVTLSAASAQTVSVNYTTADNTAQAGSDYQATSGVLTFAPGEVSKQVTVLVNGDTQVEPNETFLVTLFNPINVSIAKAIGVGTIINDDNVAAPTIQFSSPFYTINEGDPTGRVNITLTRAGDTTSSASVNYATNDAAGLQNCNVFNGVASPRCDYENTIGTMTFAAGETSKSFSVAIIDDSYAEGTETFTIGLNNPSGATLGSPSTATVTITDNDATNGPNPIDNTNFFVRQQYLDFLGREPDPPGFAGWTSTINNCSGDTTQCDRIHVSQLFFQSEEFQSRGYFVYKFYPVAFGRKPDYGEFVPDFARVNGFLDANQLEAAKVAFIASFMARPAFANAYNGLTNQQYVDALLSSAGVTLASRQAMIDGLNNSTMTRGQVLRQIVESPEVSTKYNHQAYAVMEYFGYLRRQPDGFYLQWIQVLDQSNDPRGMVTGFVNSSEYRSRFGP